MLFTSVAIALTSLVSHLPLLGTASQATAATPIATSVCEVLERPAWFDNRFVRFRARVSVNFEMSVLEDPSGACGGAIWFSYPGGGPDAFISLGPSGPVSGRQPVTLRRDGAFERFRHLVAARLFSREDAEPSDAFRYQVTATFVGRLDYGERRFGHLNMFSTQLVLQSVDAVRAKERPYDSKLLSVTRPVDPRGAIAGVLLDAEGKPAGNQWVYAEAVADEGDAPYEQADQNGRFSIKVPPGRYTLGVNIVSPPSPDTPFPASYYPRAASRERAQTIDVRSRQTVELTVRLSPRLPEQRVRVKVQWDTGAPVVQARVWLTDLAFFRNNVVGDVANVVTTDLGDATLVGHPGRRYVVRARIYVDRIPFCGESSCLLLDVQAEPLSTVLVRLDKKGAQCSYLSGSGQN